MSATTLPLRWLTAEQAATYLQLAPSTLEKMRRSGTGPRPGFKTVRYDVAELDRWVRGEKVAKQ